MGQRDPDIEVGETSDGLWIATDTGRGRLSQLAPTVVRIDVEGHGHAAFARTMIERMDQIIEQGGRLYVGIDAEGMHSYDPGFRYRWTEWIKAHAGQLDGVLILFRSHVVQSVAVIINAVIEDERMESCDEREAFEDRLASAARR